MNYKELSKQLKNVFIKPTTEGRNEQAYGWVNFIAHNKLPDNIDDNELKFIVDVEQKGVPNYTRYPFGKIHNIFFGPSPGD